MNNRPQNTKKYLQVVNTDLKVRLGGYAWMSTTAHFNTTYTARHSPETT